jgi:branched-chain amino acid transport system permease protein
MDIIVYGVINSVIFVLMAVGFSFIFGISRFPNLAHGALYLLTGFIAWSFLNDAGLPYWLSITFSLVIVSLAGVAMYQFLMIRIRGMDVSEIIATLAVGTGILEGLRIQGIGGFKGFIGPNHVLPPFIHATIRSSWVTIDFHRIIILAGGLTILGFMWLFTRYTNLGRALRATAQNPRAALMLGINSDRMDAVALGIGSLLAGLAAIFILPLSNISTEGGYTVLVNAVAVCTVGGLGSWPGTILAAFIFGFATTILPAIGGTMWNSVLIFGIIILGLILKPSGFFGKQKQFEERV